ncbi:RNA-binding motif protein 25-like isoform X2 [Gastrolobium bilobum]|uniref:RNA-binding motif protein 25-like isoform X2 n=1 Tax=Gastrolobium bilobum TaxID=150636 RepID=UPI002AAF0ED7|nr:RNA-binding motif protein 25-like isoform X2 [Gastrolobium bilobum]XP_061359546.1 RNA-binding motif protein 25-like isoform X2 [Gastrolobium bilobum]XP_061359555.1 RNA-binding motif protein 25-like isoform X2 [Gastrolobium bilobum]XP_061359564.1 RNA-binding motif protein 25-like isoform X2 [Gastrolobium bilobum]XP_061359573.1 RNA-binding motif protein 25-like isoform X2 [Gastrolobium bilobum]
MACSNISSIDVFLLCSGISRYPPPYGTMVRPIYPPRPPGAVNVIPVSRPPVAGVPPVRPIMPPVVRPAVAPSVTPAEMPQTTVYVGRIAPTVENEFMLSLLQLCGAIKSWKRPQDLSSGTPKGFGFYEFESAEGVLRALRLLTKLNIDGQELMVNVNQAMKEYLERYVQRKTENSKKTEIQAARVEKDDEAEQPPDAKENAKPDVEHSNKEDNDSGNKDSHDVANFGIVTDEDRETDREALEKITKMIEERLKTRPLPPPPAQPPGDDSVNLTSEQPATTRDGESDVDTEKNETAEDKNEKEANSDNKPINEHDRAETPDRRHDRKSRERDRDREQKREKERELERYEREAERERVRKEREQRRRVEESERQFEAYLKEWEYREREKEKERQYEKEKEKERERKRRKEILYEEEDEDEDSRKRWRRSVLEEKRKKRLREKEDDLADRQKEEEEIAEAKKRAEEDQQWKQQRDALKLLSEHVVNNGDEIKAIEEITNELKSIVAEQDTVADYGLEVCIGDGNSLNGMKDEVAMASVATTDTQSSENAPTKKLGFGLVGSGKRTAVPSFFHEEEDDDAHKDKKMRPLVPIDYSTEELQAVQTTASGPTPPNLAAAAEFAKRISGTNFKEEKLDGERDRSRRSNEKSNHRDRDRIDEDSTHKRDENKEKIPDRGRDRDHGCDRLKTSDNRRLLDAKQLIDMIPKTKEELFSFEIDWTVYDKHQLHERMRPWISKKIREFLGEEENTLIDYIVSSTQEHVKASQMLERLQIILDEEAEMFVLKMWRMLIFEIKKVETGLALRSKS